MSAPDVDPLALEDPFGTDDPDGALASWVVGSVVVFADDTASKRLAYTGLASEAELETAACDTQIDEAMAKGGFVQNKLKRRIVPFLPKQGQTLQLLEKLGKGIVCPSARHLGGEYKANGSNNIELQKRLSAMQAGFTSMGKILDVAHAIKNKKAGFHWACGWCCG